MVRAEVDRLAVDLELQAAERQHLQPGRGDHDVGLELAARREPDAGLGERLDRVGDDLRAAVGERLEQVAVGHQAEPLLPGVVVGREVLVDREALGERLRRSAARISFLASLRPAAGELVT